MRSILLALAVLLPTLAVSSELPNPLLQRRYMSGFVAPQYALKASCTIYPKVHPIYSGVVVITEQKGQSPTVTSRVKAIAWNHDVQNEATIVAFTQQSKGAKSVKLLVPADIPAIRHSAIETVGAGAPHFITLRDQNSDGDAQEIPIPPARALVKFLDQNCK